MEIKKMRVNRKRLEEVKDYLLDWAEQHFDVLACSFEDYSFDECRDCGLFLFCMEKGVIKDEKKIKVLDKNLKKYKEV